MGRQQLHISDPQNPPWSTYDELLGPFPDVMLVLSSHNKIILGLRFFAIVLNHYATATNHLPWFALSIDFTEAYPFP